MVNRSTRALDAAFAALADPTRRAMLERLAGAPATVGELAEPFDMSLPAVSKHLRVLESAGLVNRSIEGRTHRIALDPGPLRDALGWLDEQHRFWESRLASLARLLDPEAESKPEEVRWQRPKTAPTPRSASSASSRRRRSASSRRGPRPRR